MPSQQCQCGVTYQFPRSAIGKRAKCKKCGLIFLLKPDETSSIPLDGNFDLEEERQDPAPAPVIGPPRETAFDDEELSPPLGETLPSRGYAQSVLWTMLFPTSSSNLITFVSLWVVLWMASRLSSLMFMWFLAVVVAMWFAAFRFTIVQSAAAGEDDIPDVSFVGDWFSSLFLPFLAWIGSWIVVLAPALGWLILSLYRGTIDGNTFSASMFINVGGLLETMRPLLSGNRDLVVVLVLFCAGLFSWPMVVLCVALGGFGTVLRVDLMAWTMMRTIPSYLTTVMAVGVTVAAKSVIAATVGTAVGTGTGFVGAFGSSLFTSILATGAALYLDIVAMRMIGLYYHHFKHRFAWDWG